MEGIQRFAGFWCDKDRQHWFLKDHGRRGAWYCVSCDSGKSSRTILRPMQTHAEFELNWFQTWASNNRKKSEEVRLEYQTVINCQTSGSSHPARLLYPPVLSYPPASSWNVRTSSRLYFGRNGSCSREKKNACWILSVLFRVLSSYFLFVHGTLVLASWWAFLQSSLATVCDGYVNTLCIMHA